ncbi:L,D-transpeptidase family protein [Streptomyces fuscigenes]|uniref:L,D-transpeptidase family protein n=1 Tax=Streptomyces fuscigenes TaxID=1528880 RepID=UPI001F00823E|nr:L,D-transpeptidase family protein [Streptomyces fuscigenes]MCF3962041.1 L,D-transpeptidase family protein [Streptomyces fuscigenes]
MSHPSVRPGLLRALRGGSRPAAALLVGGLLLAGCGTAGTAGGHHESTGDRSAGQPDAAGTSGHGGQGAGDDGKANRSETRSALSARIPDQASPTLPGVGPRMTARIPSTTRQAVVVTGAGHDTNTATFRLYERTDADAPWRPALDVWPAHNALRGWTAHHMVDDRRSPIGVFSLTDAGGKEPDPGTKLPYDHSFHFTAYGRGFDGEPLAGAFDYVVAINYNRDPGTSPLDLDKPMGTERGGGIWIHVDHGGPTQGCVSISKDHIRQLLRTLDPESHPVVVMGDAASLAS